VPDFRDTTPTTPKASKKQGNYTKSSRTCGSFGAALTDQVAGSSANNSARNRGKPDETIEYRVIKSPRQPPAYFIGRLRLN